MSEETMAVIPVWILLFVSLGFMIGWVCGDEVRRRMNAEDRVRELSEGGLTMQQILVNTQTLERIIRDQRGVINDAHKKITAVSKGVIKPPR